jgi:uncharacterized repeat protein (TIGR01451 family)
MERGPFVRRVTLGVLLSALFLLAWVGGAQAVVLYDQMAPLQEPPVAHGSNEYMVPEPGGFDSQLAEDFIVPAGQTWTISQVDVIGEFGGTQPIPSNVNVFLYNSTPDDPNDPFDDQLPIDPPIFQQLNAPATGGPNYVIPLSGAPALGPGQYWVSVQQVGAFVVPDDPNDPNDEPEFNDWRWRVLDLQADSIGSQSALKNYPPAVDCLTWTSIHGCQDVGTRNFAFRLHAADPNADLALDKRTKADVVRPGSVVPYTIEVSNPGVAAAVNVRVCDKLPPDHSVLRAKGASVKKKRKVCWDLDSLAAGADRVFKVTTQVSLNPRQQRQRNVAVASADNVADRPRDDAVVRLRGVPDTCARSLARPIQPQPYC